ncbi:MAG: PhoH-like protein [Chlamydiae bacterium]|nr:PhoH-like protein [Chlamydiota bacterium]
MPKTTSNQNQDGTLQFKGAMPVSKTTYVIDTNVFLHDPNAILTFKDSEIVIPLPVLEELDDLKRHTDERGKNARNMIRFIDSLKAESGDLTKGVKSKNGNTIRIQASIKPMEKSEFPLPMERANNKLLMAFQIAQSNPNVVFTSKDLVMRVKAEAIGLKSQDYENLKFSYNRLYRGYRKIEVQKNEIDMFFKDGYKEIEIEGFHPNEFCLMTSPEKSSAVGRYNAKKKRLEPLLKVSQDIWGILPLNLEQKCAFDLLLRDDIKLVTLVGPAGTGKTLLTIACAMRKVFDEGLYSRILVSRPIVPLGKDIGYLPGTKEEKLLHWMQPIYDNLEFLCSSTSGEGNGETQAYIMESGKIEMEAVTYIRGRTLPKMFIIIDEAQNLTPHEVKTIISRAGQGTKVVLTGDPTQIDNPYLDKDSNGLTFTVGKFSDQNIFGHMFLEKTERSELAAIAADIM